MTLGEKISSLRGAANMSQGDLAEKLNVSRQSISKWETDASVPDLDKLILLSDLFGITLDELVRSDEVHQTTTQSAPTASLDHEPVQPQIIIQKSVSTQKVIGFILLALGLLCCVLALVLGGGLLLGAIFMATDYVTSPYTLKGKIVFGIGLGVITMLIRVFGTMTEGVSYAILLMNLFVPYINQLTRQKPLGAPKKVKEAK